MKKLLFIGCMLCMVLGVWAQTFDTKCMTLMDVPLEGTDSVFVKSLQGAGFQQVFSADDDPDTYYYKGDFYAIKMAKF